MMRKIKLLYFLLAFSMLFGSCKQFLDLKPYGKTIPSTPDEFSSLLHEFLNKVDYGTDEVVLGGGGNLLKYESFTDNMETSLVDVTVGRTLPVYVGSSIRGFSSTYSKLYAQIRDCNIIIERIKEEDRATQLGKNVLGAAHAIRGVCYYNLVRWFAEPYEKNNANNQLGVPLVKVFDMEEKPLRDKLSDCVDFIIEDFNKAIEYNVTVDAYRFTKDIAKFYLARTYFWKEDWVNASLVAKELLDKYPLIEGEAYKEMMQEELNKKGNVILKSFIYPGDVNNEFANQLSMSCPISKRFVDLFKEGEKDIRFSFYYNEERKNTKYLGVKLRSAEMCLILAECYAHIGSKEKLVLDNLNLLRSKRIVNYTPYTLNTLPAVSADYIIKEDAEGKALTPLTYAILLERQRELYMEGDRWFELKRNGRPEFWATRDGLKYETKKFLYTAPIPMQDGYLVNGLKQNPGYEN